MTFCMKTRQGFLWGYTLTRNYIENKEQCWNDHMTSSTNSIHRGLIICKMRQKINEADNSYSCSLWVHFCLFLSHKQISCNSMSGDVFSLYRTSNLWHCQLQINQICPENMLSDPASASVVYFWSLNVSSFTFCLARQPSLYLRSYDFTF